MKADCRWKGVYTPDNGWDNLVVGRQLCKLCNFGVGIVVALLL